MKNQEVYLNKFLDDGNISCNNLKAERKFAFFAILRNQIKMFGSTEGIECAALLESIEQTNRDYFKDTRIYYQFLFDEFIPFVNRQEPGTDYQSLDETMNYLPWSKRYEEYRGPSLSRNGNWFLMPGKSDLDVIPINRGSTMRWRVPVLLFYWWGAHYLHCTLYFIISWL